MWLRRPEDGMWDEAIIVLYAEMGGTAKDVDNLNDLFGNFILGLEE